MFKLTVNGKEAVANAKAQALKVAVKNGDSYVITDTATGKSPAKLIAKKVKKDLFIFEEGADKASVILEDYYAEGNVVQLGGVSQSGSMLAYNTAEGGFALAPVAEAASATAATTAAATAGSGFLGSTASYVLGGLAVVGGGVAVAASSSSDASAPTVAPETTVNGTVTAGPVIAGHQLSVEIYKADGTTLLGTATLSATGTFSINIGTYTGVIIAKVVDSATGADFTDEATNVAKDLNATLTAVAVVAGGTVTLNINPVTTIAAIEAGLGTNGSGNITSSTTVTAANAAVATAFGLANITATTPVTTLDTAYSSADGMSEGEKYGAVLAALSGADQNNGGDMQATINVVAMGLSGTTFDTLAQSEIIAGANSADANVIGDLKSAVTTLIAPNAATDATALGNNLSAATVTTLTPAVIANLTNTQVATLTDAQVAALTNDQLAVLTSAQMDAMATAQNLDNLSAAQVAALPATTIDSVPAAVMATLTDAQVAALTNDQLAVLTSAQMDAMATAQNLDDLSDTQISALPITSTLLFNMFTAAGSGTGATDTAVDAYNYLTNIALQQHDITSSDGTTNQTDSAKILAEYINQVTGTDIVSDAEFDAGFTITGHAAAGSTIKFFLDNNRINGTNEVGTELVNSQNGVTIAYDNATGNYTITFDANSTALLQATHNTYGSGIHQLTVDTNGNGAKDGTEASRTFLVADGTASTSDTGTIAQNYSVQDAVTGDVFVYYYGDPDGNGVGMWTLQDSGDTASNTGTVTTDRDSDGNGWGDWDYYNTTDVSGGTEATAQNTALGFVTDIQAQTWEFHMGKTYDAANNGYGAGDYMSQGNADANASDHTLWNSNTSRLASEEELYALYAANFGADTGGGAAGAQTVGAIQAISDTSSSINGNIASEDNRPSGWAYVVWSSSPTPSGHGNIYLLNGHSADYPDGNSIYVTAVL